MKSVKSTAGFRSRSYQVTLLTLFLFSSHLEVNSFQDFSSLCCTLLYVSFFVTLFLEQLQCSKTFRYINSSSQESLRKYSLAPLERWYCEAQSLNDLFYNISKWEGQDLNPSRLVPDPMDLKTACFYYRTKSKCYILLLPIPFQAPSVCQY